jgi:hypothetical protein
MAAPQMPKDRLFIPAITVVGIAILVFSGLTVFSILKSRSVYLHEAVVKSSGQAQLLGENAASLINEVDLTLLAIRSTVTERILDSGNGGRAVPGSS